MFQIVRCLLDDRNGVVARHALQPSFELWGDAAAMAEFDSSRLWEQYGYDEERGFWWAKDSLGRMHRFEIEEIAQRRLRTQPLRRELSIALERTSPWEWGRGDSRGYVHAAAERSPGGQPPDTGFGPAGG